MNILCIVGSPRKEGRSSALMDAVIDGARAAGAITEKLYLVDHDIRPYSFGTGAPPVPKALSALVDAADALVIGAPVYWGDINGLTKDFCDSVQLSMARGKPALGFAIAGGSGKGLISGVQSLYHWFFHRQYRAIDPTPVSRFNFESALAELRESGKRLAGTPLRPFAGAGWNDRWGDCVAHYAGLRYLTADMVDEFVLLAQQLVAGADPASPAYAVADAAYQAALLALAQGDRPVAGRHAVRAYDALFIAE